MSIPQTPIVNAASLYVNNLAIVTPSTTTVTITQGSARNSTNINDIINNSSLTINGLLVGANGCDIAPLVASSSYAVYVIGDSTGYKKTAGLLSLSAASPSLPSGYDMFRRIGWARTDGSSHILQTRVYGSNETRTYFYETPISVLTAGTSTTFAAVSTVSAVGPVDTTALINVVYTPALAANVASFSATGIAGIVNFGCGVAAAQNGMLSVPTGSNQFFYKVEASDSLNILVCGFEDYIF